MNWMVQNLYVVQRDPLKYNTLKYNGFNIILPFSIQGEIMNII